MVKIGIFGEKVRNPVPCFVLCFAIYFAQDLVSWTLGSIGS